MPRSTRNRRAQWPPPLAETNGSPTPFRHSCSSKSISAYIKELYQQHRNYSVYKCVCLEEFQADANERKCICGKSAADLTTECFIITSAGNQKLILELNNTSLRDPGYFDMNVYNDFAGYGVLEVLQNLILDFTEAQDDWQEQWAVCETIPLYWRSGAAMPFTMLDVDTVIRTCSLLGRMFLAMLASLEFKNHLGPNSGVKNLGFIMILYVLLAEEFREKGFLEEGSDIYQLDAFVWAYATKHQITLHGPSKVATLLENIETQIHLPCAAKDPWKWASAVRGDYMPHIGAIPSIGKKEMGGDSFDFTAWSSVKRRQYNFDGIDPLGEDEIADIKQSIAFQLTMPQDSSG